MAALGKYAPFILGAYGVSALVIAWLVAASLAHARRWRRRYEASMRK